MSIPSKTPIALAEGILSTPYRNVVNPNHDAGAGSIHDDATATKLGFRGGTVAGNNHMDLFAPLGLHAFGQPWFERGSLSLYFRNATIDREPVSARIRVPAAVDNVQTDAWVFREDGMLVAEGTIACGTHAEPTALQRIPMDEISPEGCRILARIQPGEDIPAQGFILSSKAADERMAVNTENLTWYAGDSPWGARVASPAAYINALWGPPTAHLRKRVPNSVGLFGAIEIRNVNGPLLVDTPYTISGKVLAVGQSPKTEFFWFESWADDQSGRRVAEHRMLLRFMKASSELWKE